MARGRKPAISLDEKLIKITKEIENTENTLKELKQAKKDLQEQIKKNRLMELDELIAANGLTFDEVIGMLNKSKDKE